MISATVTGGIANTVRNAITRIIQVNTGMRSSDIPGQRMLMAVTMKLIAEVVDPMPRRISPTVQKSGPRPGQEPGVERSAGERRVAEPPAVGSSPRKKLEYMKIPPMITTQNPNMLIRGNATSRAPIWSGRK